MYCCVNCFNNKEIKDGIISLSEKGNCDFCGKKDVYICNINSDIFFATKIILKQLSPSPNGFEIQRFTTKQINLFNTSLSEATINKLILNISEFLTTEDLDKKYAMPYDFSRLVQDWWIFSKTIKYKDRFGYGISERLKEALQYILEANKYTIKENEFFYRARLGFKQAKERRSFAFRGKVMYYDEIIEEAFSGDDIMAPPSDLVTEGRLNPRGISYLYIAADEQTAIAEVRPHKNKRVSIAQVRTKSDLLISCFDNITFFEVSSLKEQVDLYLLTNYLNVEFSYPIDDETRYLDYLPTQYVSELAKNLGIEGIRYSSSLENGYNLCIYAKEKFDYCKSGIATVTSVNLTIEKPTLK